MDALTQVYHIKCCRRPLPLSVEVDCIRHFVKSIVKFFSCFVLYVLGSLGTWNFPLARFTDLGFRSDLTGIGDISVAASVLGLNANLKSFDVKGEKFSSAVSVGVSVLGLDAKSPDVKGETLISTD